MGKKVLVIEDEESFVYAYKIAFEKVGVEVFFAKNGLEGLKMAKSHSPSIILLDLVMPEMDGYTFLQKIKSEPVISAIPIIVMSSLPTSAVESSIDKSAVVEILSKSDNSPKKIIEIIQKYL